MVGALGAGSLPAWARGSRAHNRALGRGGLKASNFTRIWEVRESTDSFRGRQAGDKQMALQQFLSSSEAPGTVTGI